MAEKPFRPYGDDVPEERYDYMTLANLTGSFFFQDYEMWGETPDEIVEVYKYEFPVQRETLISDIRRFLARYGAEESRLVEAYERIFRPEMAIYGWNGRTLHEALNQIVVILTDETNPGRPRPE